MDIKTCKTCNQDKPVSEFSVNKINKNGNPNYKAHCKECLKNKYHEDKNKETSSDKVKIPIKEGIQVKEENQIKENIVKPDNNEKKESNFMDLFDNSVVVEMLLSKDSRVKKTFNLSQDSFKLLMEYQQETKLNSSDLINLIMFKFNQYLKGTSR